MKPFAMVISSALAGLAFVTQPTPAAAALPGFDTVETTCVGGAIGCSQVDFLFSLSPAGSATLDFFRIFLLGPGWSFSQVQGGEAADFYGDNFFTALVSADGSDLHATFDPWFAAEVSPTVRLRAQMADNPHADGSSLALRYEAGQGAVVTYSGVAGPATVTPEPASMVLLGTGLAGVAGILRRRRREDGDGGAE